MTLAPAATTAIEKRPAMMARTTKGLTSDPAFVGNFVDADGSSVGNKR